MRLRCQRCKADTPEELEFCLSCRSRLVFQNSYDLSFEDYAYGPDRDAIENMKVVGALPYLFKKFAVRDFERNMLGKLSRQASRITFPSDLDRLARRCASTLSLAVLPEIFVMDERQMNAFTFGSEEHPVLVIDSSLLELLDSQEVMSLLGHELGHVKSGHMLYHTLGEILSGGIAFSASLFGLDVLSIPIRFALLSWHRESEVTADRTSLLAVNDIGAVKSLMTKLAQPPTHVEATFGSVDIERSRAGTLEGVSELFRTHPLFANRFRLAKEFAESEEFARVRRKIELRQTLAKAFTMMCRHCGAEKKIVDTFCPACGRCQA